MLRTGSRSPSLITTAKSQVSLFSLTYFQWRPTPFPMNLKRVIQAFITTHVDHCNSLCVGLAQLSFHRLQAVQKQQPLTLTGKKQQDDSTPVQASLLWLPIHFRIQFYHLFLTVLITWWQPLLCTFAALHSIQATEVFESIGHGHS